MNHNFKVDILIGGITIGIGLLEKKIFKREIIPFSIESFGLIFLGSAIGRSIIDETEEKISGIRKRLMESISGK